MNDSDSTQVVTANPAPAASYGLLGRDAERHTRKFFSAGLVLLACAGGYFTVTSQTRDFTHVMLGLGILTFAVLPMLLWFKNGGGRFPAFESMMLLSVGAYALPLLREHEHLQYFSGGVITRAALAVLLYLVTGFIVYQSTPGLPRQGRFWRESILTRGVERTVSHGIILSTVFITVSTFTDWIPDDLFSVLRAIFYGIGTICTFVATQRWGRGELTSGDRGLFGLFLVAQLLFMATSLLLVQAITLMGVAFMGYLSGGRGVPWRTMLLAFAIVAVLHNGKFEMRRIYWEEKKPAPGLLGLPSYYAEWLRYGLTPDGGSGGKGASRRLIERTSLMHILCLVAEYSPSRQPYLEGRTYANVLPQLIPRFFWPDKPRSHISTYQLSIYYGLQDEDATQTATIAFGQLAEAYANFGLLGAMALGAFHGFFIRKLQWWSRDSPMFSLAGLMMILVTAWSFNGELTMAAWVSSLFQALIVVLGLPLLLRGLFGS